MCGPADPLTFRKREEAQFVMTDNFYAVNSPTMANIELPTEHQYTGVEKTCLYALSPAAQTSAHSPGSISCAPESHAHEEHLATRKGVHGRVGCREAGHSAFLGLELCFINHTSDM